MWLWYDPSLRLKSGFAVSTSAPTSKRGDDDDNDDIPRASDSLIRVLFDLTRSSPPACFLFRSSCSGALVLPTPEYFSLLSVGFCWQVYVRLNDDE